MNFSADFSCFFNKTAGTMSDEEFEKLCGFVKSRYGLDLTGKKQMTESRLTNYVLDRGFSSFSEYLPTVYDEANVCELTNLINRLTTNYTYFCREQEHFDHFENVFLPAWEQTGRQSLNIWSAGCSYGNEAYTFAMYLAQYFGLHSTVDKRILATDISSDALLAAKAGVYSKQAVSKLPYEWVKKYFKENGGLFKVDDELRSQVIFKFHNLMQPISFKQKFDLIICRNVMIYFDEQTRDKLVGRFYDAISTGGFLYIGHAETLSKDTPFKRECAGVYRKV